MLAGMAHALSQLTPVRTLPVLLTIRILLDVLWWIPRWGALGSVLRVGTVALMAVAAASLTTHRGWRLMDLAGFTLVAAALWRSPMAAPDIILALKLMSAWLCFALAREAMVGRSLEAFESAVIAALTTTAVVSLVAGLLSPGAWDYVTDTYRLRGVYWNVHNLALAMAFGSVMAAYRGARGSRGAWVSAGCMLAALSLSYTRSSMLFVAVGLLGLVAEPRFRKPLFGIAAAVLFVQLADPSARTRWVALFAPLAASDTDAWMELGTGRMRMWTSSFSAFSSLGPADWLFGHGIRGTERFWKPKGPANDLLYILYQFGVVGFLGAVAAFGHCLRRAWMTPSAYRGQIVSTLLACGLVACLSDSVVSRVTPSWLFAVWMAAALTAGSGPLDERQHELRVPEPQVP